MNNIYVEVIATRGSAPRDAGTAMAVSATEIQGTIGGGALEHQAIAQARRMLKSGGHEKRQTLPLGPGLGQCCGGSVTLLFTREKRAIDPVFAPPTTVARPDAPWHLWLWGAGHVGRAIVNTPAACAFDITWVDTGADRFPAQVPGTVTCTAALDMPRLAAHAPRTAAHLIFTYSHDIDLALCAALLRRGAPNIGLIGSDTKKARFFRRLGAMGLDPAAITCPIGDKSLGKRPDAIARGTLAALLAEPLRKVSA